MTLPGPWIPEYPSFIEELGQALADGETLTRWVAAADGRDAGDGLEASRVRAVRADPVGDLPAQAAHPAFHDRVRSGCLDRCLDDLDALGLEDGIEGAGELGIPVAEQEPELAGLVAEVEQEITRLLGDPRGGWLGGDAEHVDPAGGVLGDGEAVQPCQRDGLGVEEVNRQDAGGLCLEELVPARAGSPRCGVDTGLLQDGPHGRRRDLAAQPRQFPGDAPVAPGGGFRPPAAGRAGELSAGWVAALVAAACASSAASPGRRASAAACRA